MQASRCFCCHLGSGLRTGPRDCKVLVSRPQMSFVRGRRVRMSQARRLALDSICSIVLLISSCTTKLTNDRPDSGSIGTIPLALVTAPGGSTQQGLGTGPIASIPNTQSPPVKAQVLDNASTTTLQRSDGAATGTVRSASTAAADGSTQQRPGVAPIAAIPATAPAKAPKSDKTTMGPVNQRASSSEHARCCDGSISSTCTCGGSKRGCCSRHGGVCGCE